MKLDVSDEQLAILAQMGNNRASEILLNKYKPHVRSICKRFFMVGATKEDIIQEGMIGLYRAIMNYRPEKNSSFSAFAFMCIRRHVVTKVQGANRKKNQPLNTSVSLSKPVSDNGMTLGEIIEDESQDPEIMFIASENKQNAKKRISDMLSPFEKRILIEYLKDKTYDEIAKKLNVTTKSVDNAMQRIKNKISRLKV